MFLLALALAFLPVLSLAFPSSHPRSLHRKAPHRPRIMTYYPDWSPPKSADYSLFDVILFAFALPDQNYNLAWDTDQAPNLLADIVPSAHAQQADVVLSIGGWTGSRYFSDAVSTAQNRETFVSNIRDAYKRFNIDGIDIDWEYPGQLGQGNTERASDSDNMLLFFRLLRHNLPGALISAAVQDNPFVGSDGRPTKDVSAFCNLVDFITLMNYDTNGARQPPGPNAPLSDACGNSSQPTQSAVSAYKVWTAAGCPAHKIVLGVPGYGYIVESNSARLSARSAFRAHSEDSSGQVQFQSLVEQGILVQNPNGSFSASAGFERDWDDCSSTPFLHSSSAGQVIPYDDVESLGIKAAWARDMYLGGVNLFDIHSDTPQHHLTHALRANLFPDAVKLTNLSSVLPSASSSAMALPLITIPTPASTALSNVQPQFTSAPPSLSTPLPNGIVQFSRGA